MTYNVVSTLIWHCATLRYHINLKATLNRRWNVCWSCFFRSCTFTCFLINADANVNKIVFPVSSTHFRNDFLSNSYENITFSIQKKQAHINLILLSQLIQTLDCTSIFIYPVSAVGSIWIPNSNTGFGHKIHMDTAILKQ